jgi:diguanylate cyclase (GGDEF)-like protein
LALRTRIALTFLLLLAAALAAALGAVSASNERSAEREVARQLNVGSSVFSRLLESNRRQLTQAAQAVAADYGFREAVATHDLDTLKSALQNSGERVGAAMVVLTSLSGEVMAASGAQVQTGAPFPIAPLQTAGSAGGAAIVMVDSGRIYQVIAVPVRSPLPVACIVMGFELDDKAARELADITGLGVVLSIMNGDHWRNVVDTLPAAALRGGDVVTRRIEMATVGDSKVVAILSRSLSEARAPFETLERRLVAIGVLSLLASALAAFWLARNITRPLQNLTELVNKMRAGFYDATQSVQRRDELGVLAEGLHLMQSAVQSRDHSIRRLAYEDTLTGLMNRTAFGAALQEALADPSSAPIGVVVINLNRFRRINEHLGYSVGDAVLTKMAERIAAVPSVNTAAARLAADQFAAFTRLHDRAGLQAWGTTLLLALTDPVYVEAQPIDISATLGLVATGPEHLSADELMRCAELALDRARREKRPFSLYEQALKPVALDQLSLLGELRHAVEHDELRLFFQPKIEMSTNRIAGAEVLLRWQHPTRGLLGPVDFIPFAEQTGFIRRLTRWTLDHAIAQGAEWHRNGKPLSLAVNISVEDVGDPRLDSRIAAYLTRHQLPPALLTLELTESGFIEDPQRALQMLETIAALGVLLSIDDFGTGYSSLSHLTRMPVHEVKIDKSFVKGLETHNEIATVVRSAIDMGHGLGLKVVAEGIETATAAARLKEFRCDIAQGYLYAKPMSLRDFEVWLEGKEHVPVIAVPVAFTVDDVTDTVNLATY